MLYFDRNKPRNERVNSERSEGTKPRVFKRDIRGKKDRGLTQKKIAGLPNTEEELVVFDNSAFILTSY